MMLPHSLDTEVVNDQQQIICQEFTTSRGSPHTHYLIVTCHFMQIYECMYCMRLTNPRSMST